MGRITKVIGFSVPPSLAEEIEQVANTERRTKSEMFREMFRVYQVYRKQREQGEERWVMDLIREAKEEQEKHPITPEELVRELQEIGRYGAQQAKKLGLKPRDVGRVSGDRHRRRLNIYQGIPIVRPIDFLRTPGVP